MILKTNHTEVELDSDSILLVYVSHRHRENFFLIPNHNVFDRGVLRSTLILLDKYGNIENTLVRSRSHMRICEGFDFSFKVSISVSNDDTYTQITAKNDRVIYIKDFDFQLKLSPTEEEW